MLNELNAALRSRIIANSSIITELGGTAVWAMQAPPNTPLPYVIFSYAAGGDENDTPLNSIDVRYLVKCIAGSASKAATVAGLLRTQLHDADNSVSMSGWNVYAVEHTTPVQYIENEQSSQYFHAGGVYRIRASKG